MFQGFEVYVLGLSLGAPESGLGFQVRVEGLGIGVLGLRCLM